MRLLNEPAQRVIRHLPGEDPDHPALLQRVPHPLQPLPGEQDREDARLLRRPRLPMKCLQGIVVHRHHDQLPAIHGQRDVLGRMVPLEGQPPAG